MTDGYKAYVTNMEAYVNMIIENGKRSISRVGKPI